MRKKMIVILIALFLLGCSVTVSAQTLEVEREYLARAIAESYEAVSFGGKVSISAVAVNLKEAGLADSLAGSVAILASEGEFEDLGKGKGKIDEEMYRICRDAVDAAVAGADPTGGATNFRRLAGKVKADLRFDDSREDALDREMRRELERLAERAGSEVTPTLVDGIGFY